MLHVTVDYPDAQAEREILRLVRRELSAGYAEQSLGASAAESSNAEPSNTRSTTAHIEPVTERCIFAARREILDLHMAPAVEEYIVQLVVASRKPEMYDATLKNWLDYGASPRATLALDRCARANAWLHGNDFVTPDDVQAVAHDVMRHRLIVSFEAEANGIDANAAIDKLIEIVPVV